MINKKLKKKKCKNCPNKFMPKSISHIACCFECAGILAKQEIEKKRSKEWKVKKKALKLKLATLSDYRKKARYQFQRWIRLRDLGKTCISCPIKLTDIRDFDAGHYLSAFLHSELLFDEIGTNGQCIYCNHRLSGNQSEYRKGLIERYGSGEVERLESSVGGKKWIKDEYLIIENEYKDKIKCLNL